MIEAHFGESSPFSLGVEEELMILDAERLRPAGAVEKLLDGARARELPGLLKTELHASVVELNTKICPSAADVGDALVELRSAAFEIGSEHGLVCAAAGSHPSAVPEELPVAREERYREFVEYAGPSARRQGVSGLHVHVGMPGPDECHAALEGVLPWLPLVLALSANSPYLAGRETGLLSARAEVLGLLPRHGAPPPFASYADWERFVERMAEAPFISNYTVFWWDVRPHPRFGTLEIRMPDQPTSPALSVAFVALLQALCVVALREPPRTPDAVSRGIYEQNRWAASRFGPRAELLHPDRTEPPLPANVLFAELVDRIAPVLSELGTEHLVAAIDPSRCEADRQLEIGRRDGADAVARDIVERSIPSAA